MAENAPVARDFKYSELLRAGSTWDPVLKSLEAIRSACLSKCVTAFIDNLTRTTTFAVMPASVAFLARREQNILDKAHVALTGEHPSIGDYLGERPDGYKEMLEQFTRGGKTIPALPDGAGEELFNRLGIVYIEALARRTAGMDESMDAVFASIVIESWMAFECLAGDLWCVAVNHGPGEIQSRLLISNQLLRPDENITENTLVKCEFNPRTHFGSFLREIGRVSFQKLELIRRFYRIAFGQQVSKLFDSVENGYIVALAAFRNVIIHSAGKVDSKFIDQIDGRFPEFQFAKDQKLILDGEIVRNLRQASAVLGLALINAIDDMITPPVTT